MYVSKSHKRGILGQLSHKASLRKSIALFSLKPWWLCRGWIRTFDSSGGCDDHYAKLPGNRDWSFWVVRSNPSREWSWTKWWTFTLGDKVHPWGQTMLLKTCLYSTYVPMMYLLVHGLSKTNREANWGEFLPFGQWLFLGGGQICCMRYFLR
jgi:hypothetical protein